jgi:hypothetical protein
MKEANSAASGSAISNPNNSTDRKSLRTFPEVELTVMTWGKGKLLFRNAKLGIEPTYAHGHADACNFVFLGQHACPC